MEEKPVILNGYPNLEVVKLTGRPKGSKNSGPRRSRGSVQTNRPREEAVQTEHNPGLQE